MTGSVPDPDLRLEPMPDVQAALTALAHRPHRPERQAIKLTGKHLAGALLAEVNLAWAGLARANLTRANLTRAHLLTGANLTRAHLAGANLAGAVWPRLVAVPEGWERDADGRRLQRSSTSRDGQGDRN